MNLQMGDAAAYIPTDVQSQWIKRTVDVTVPVGAGTVQLELRFYKGATIYIDDVSFLSVPTNIPNTNANSTKFTLKGRTMESKSIANGTVVEIFTALGTKVQTAVLVNGSVQLNDLSKGLYIVRAGKYTQKIIL